MKDSIAIAGSILVDKINEISAYPQEGELTKILNVEKSVGGCVPNVAIDIKKICPDLVVKAVGKIGDDENGEYVKQELAKQGVDISSISICQDKTSFTEVMSVKGGQRTFFTYPGASSKFGYDDVDFDKIDVKMLHLGYLLLLDRIDNGDGIRVLKNAKKRGVITSIDLVSENSRRYTQIIPCLPYVDNLIINEIEASGITGIEPKRENLIIMAKALKEKGVIERVIIHTSEVSVCVSNSGEYYLPSYDLPKEFIVGTTGAGDAFCAGALVAISENRSDMEILEFASSSAVVALSTADATSGLCEKDEIVNSCQRFKRKKICL